MSESVTMENFDPAMGPDGDESEESLVDFLAAEGVTGPQDESGDTEGTGPKVSKAGAKKALSDDPGDDGRASDGEDDSLESRRATSHSRMVTKLAQRERELSAERQALRERDRRIKELEARIGQADPDDDVVLLRGRIARRLNVQATDRAVDEALFELSRDLTLDHLGTAADADPEIKRVREERQAEKRRRDEIRQLNDRYDRLERQKQDSDREVATAGARSAVSDFLTRNSEAHPFLMAQDDVDPIATVTELALEAVRTGQASVSTDADVIRLLGQLASGLDRRYRGLAEKLSKKLLSPADSRDDGIDVTTDDAGKAKKQAPRKRTGTTGTGGGGRGRPTADVSNEQDDDDSLASFMRNQTARENAASRRR